MKRNTLLKLVTGATFLFGGLLLLMIQKQDVVPISAGSKFFIDNEKGKKSSRARFAFGLSKVENSFAKRGAIDFPSEKESEYREFRDWFIELARTNSAKAEQVLSEYSLTHDKRSSECLHSVYAQTLARLNPDLAIEWADAIENPEMASLMLNQVFYAIGVLDPHRTLNLVQRFAGSGWASSTICESLKQVAKNSPEDALNWISKNLNSYPKVYLAGLSSIFYGAALGDPGSFVRLIEQNDFGRGGDDALRSAFGGLVSSDFDKAIKLAAAADSKSSNGCIILEEFARFGLTKEPDKVTDLLMGKNGDDASKVIAAGLSVWIGTDSKRAMEWVARQPLKLQQDMAGRGVVGALSLAAPQLALKYVEGLHLPSEEQIGVYSDIVRVWGESEPGASLKWIVGLNEGEQLELIESYVEAVALEDPALIPEFLENEVVIEAVKNKGYKRLEAIEGKR
jgi:hypothetical protein